MAHTSAISGIGTLTKQDWEEIYYAVADKMLTNLVKNDKKWTKHMESIMDKIGIDGDDAFNSTKDLLLSCKDTRSAYYDLLEACKLINQWWLVGDAPIHSGAQLGPDESTIKQLIRRVVDKAEGR